MTSGPFGPRFLAVQGCGGWGAGAALLTVRWDLCLTITLSDHHRIPYPRSARLGRAPRGPAGQSRARGARRALGPRLVRLCWRRYPSRTRVPRRVRDGSGPESLPPRRQVRLPRRGSPQHEQQPGRGQFDHVQRGGQRAEDRTGQDRPARTRSSQPPRRALRDRPACAEDRARVPRRDPAAGQGIPASRGRLGRIWVVFQAVHTGRYKITEHVVNYTQTASITGKPCLKDAKAR